MSESLFFLCSVSAVYLARRGRWLPAGLVGAMAAFTRSLGALVFIPLFMEALSLRIRSGDRRAFLRGLAGSLAVFLGTGVYLFMNYRLFGNPLQFLWFEDRYFGQHFAPFFGVTAQLLDSGLAMLNPEDYSAALGMSLPNVAYCFSALLVMFFAARRLRPSYTAWFIAYYVLATGASNLISAPRYLVAAMPLYPALAVLCQDKRVDRVLAPLCLFFALLYFYMFTRLWSVF